MKTIRELIEGILPGDLIHIGSVALPYTIQKTGILTINITTKNISSSTPAYLYLKKNSMAGYQCCWSGFASGGQSSISMGVRKGDVITGVSNNINTADWNLLPIIGGVLRSINPLRHLFNCEEVVA